MKHNEKVIDEIYKEALSKDENILVYFNLKNQQDDNPIIQAMKRYAEYVEENYYRGKEW